MSSYKKGASFLLDDVGSEEVFILEEVDEATLALGQTAHDFIANDVLPKSDALEKQEPGVSISLLKKAGEIGLLMAEVPEKYNGLGLNKVAATVLAENCTAQGSFSVTMLCHTGIGTLPILYYGTEAQKQTYLPKLATGEFVGAYALTEAGSGSDALAAKTKAVLSADGKHYILNGEKMFITNGAWADVITVFAKVDGEKFTGFIVEKDMPGVTHGPEEKKMGIKGSSTTTIILQDAKVPVENVLGQVGRGHKIAFNVLNVGRWKLGAASIGNCKNELMHAVKYVKERKQFGQPLADFELIQTKIANCAVRTFITESMMYRYAHDLDQALATLDSNATDYYDQYLKAVEAYNIEASICKVYGSEANAFVADEAVQMHGGYGFIQEYPIESAYRDCRITRIFEGTNEINRLLITGTLFKRAMSGEMDLMGPIQEVIGQLKTGFTMKGEGVLANSMNNVNQLKKLTLYISGVAVQKYMADIKDRQSFLAEIADFIIEVYAVDSALARTLKLLKINGQEKAAIPMAMVRTYITDKCNELVTRAKQFCANICRGDEEGFAKYEKAIDRILKPKPRDTLNFRLDIAAHCIEHDGYAL